MYAIEPILYYLIAILIIFGSGIWLTKLLIPQSYRKYYLAFSILFGICWLIIFSSWTSYAGLGFKQSSYLIVSISFLLSAIAIFNDIKKGFIKDWIPDKKQALVCFIGFLSGLVILFPVIFFNGLRPYVDGFTYISIADYMLNHGYFEKANPNPYYPWLTQMSLYQQSGFRMGAQFFLSLITALFNQKFSIELFMPSLAVGQFCLVLATWLFCKVGLKLLPIAPIFATLFVAFHVSIPITYSYNGFLPQAFGVFISLLCYTIFLNIVNWRDSKRFVASASIALSALIVTYSEILPFVGLSIIAVLIYHVFQDHSQIKHITFKIFLTAIVTSTLSNISLINAVRAILFQVKAVVGWNITYTLWDYIQILLCIPKEELDRISLGHPAINLFLTIIVLWALYVVLKYCIFSIKWQDSLKLLLVLAIPFILTLSYFSFIAENPWIPGQRGHTWNIYKVIQYSYIFIPPIIGISIYNFCNEHRKIKKLVMVISSIVFIVFTTIMSILYSNSLVGEMRRYTGNTQNPLNEYYKLYDHFKNNNQVINIIAPTNLEKHKQLLAYFLRDHELISDWKNDGYIYPYLLPEYQSPKLKENGVNLVYNPNSPNQIANMEISTEKVFLEFKSGAYDIEENNTMTWRWSSGTVDIELNNFSNEKINTVINFDATLAPTVNEQQRLEIVYDDKILKSFILTPNKSTQCEIGFDVKEGKSALQLKYSGTGVKVGADPRNLAFNIINFKYSSK